MSEARVERTQDSPARALTALIGTLACVAPVVAGIVLLAASLHQRPSARTPLAISSGQRAVLNPGSQTAVELHRDRWAYRAVVLVAAADSAVMTVRLRLCAGPQCETHEVVTSPGAAVRLGLPAGFHGGELTLQLLDSTGGPLILDAMHGAPPAELVQGYSWRLPIRRAREVLVAQAGTASSWPIWVLGLGALLLPVGLTIALALRPALGEHLRGEK